ncbi:jg21473 [Pararge aegeria aegeria]|uniref:Jg21473 protein n=1 Tax=Pararge aegeria aegeria TaxID=348720 RepID=A0A8S4RM94_9NEOP|nr:jg21473 [Pararge aegeria aegeria]
MGRAQNFAMRRAPGLDDIGGNEVHRAEGVSCEDSDLGSARRNGIVINLLQLTGHNTFIDLTIIHCKVNI